MKNLFALMAIILGLAFALPGHAQDRFTLEVRGGGDIATQDLGQVSLQPGYGFEGILNYSPVSYFGIYTGWAWNKFVADKDYTGLEQDFEETGYMLGLSSQVPLRNASLAIYGRAGGIYNHIEIENVGGDIIEDSGHGWGWQVSAGVDISLGSGWQLRPGIKYQSLTRDLEMEARNTSVDLNYLQVGIGIAKIF